MYAQYSRIWYKYVENVIALLFCFYWYAMIVDRLIQSSDSMIWHDNETPENNIICKFRNCIYTRYT